ncbi:MAG TPA: permease prefix domain 2-containing transporter, partial [Chryseolinea sp.]|nr:permease prefix domain 2-containing transporter [Chryseolinea sp.]
MAQGLLQKFLRHDLAEEVLGDLEEKFYATLKTKSALFAKLIYWFQVMNYLRPFAIRKSKPIHSNHYAMFQSYFKIGWRNLLKNKGYSLINIGGL